MKKSAKAKQFQITLFENEIFITTPTNINESYKEEILLSSGKSIHIIDRGGSRFDFIETGYNDLNYYECCGVLILFGITPPSFDELLSLLDNKKLNKALT